MMCSETEARPSDGPVCPGSAAGFRDYSRFDMGKRTLLPVILYLSMPRYWKSTTTMRKKSSGRHIERGTLQVCYLFSGYNYVPCEVLCNFLLLLHCSKNRTGDAPSRQDGTVACQQSRLGACSCESSVDRRLGVCGKAGAMQAGPVAFPSIPLITHAYRATKSGFLPDSS